MKAWITLIVVSALVAHLLYGVALYVTDVLARSL